jgi:organic hydroperoxide reductase OsmC/OhrA
MITYPIDFEARASAAAGIAANWNAVASGHSSPCAVPPEFDGPGGAFSPEDYFLLAIQNCFIASFKVFAEYSRLSYSELTVAARLTVDKDASGKPWMDAAHLVVELRGALDAKKAELLVKKTIENGFILRSVKTKITFELSLL